MKTTMKETLLQLMAIAGIPEADYETTTLAQLALRLDKRGTRATRAVAGHALAVGGIAEPKIATYARCGGCGATYTLGTWIRLAPTGYFGRDGELTRPGHKPDFEGRTCKQCGQELRMPAPAGAPTAVPFYQNGF